MTSVRQALDLAGRKAIVTGGSKGLGLQIAEALGEMGAEVLIAARGAEGLAAAVDRLASQGVKAQALAADLSDPAAVPAFAAEALTRVGHCDILVNNAGATFASPTEDHPLDAWTRVMDVNLTAPFLLVQAIGRDSMIPRRYGRILNIVSPAGLKGNPRAFRKTLAYNASKGALVNFTRALAAEWGPHGITVNAIAPGVFPTALSGPALAAMQAYFEANAPLGRVGGDGDLKGAALLFCSDAGRYVTGQVLSVDGGISVV